MSGFLILGCVVIVLASFVFFPKDKNTSTGPKLKRDKSEESKAGSAHQHNKQYTQKSKHAAVTIAYEPDACDSVKALDNVRFLVREAPLLPIRGCTKSKACECQYLHHVDRRKTERKTGVAFAANTDINKQQAISRKEDQSKRA